ncbi:immunoglobulin-like domain-containing protein [Moritella sp. Urea-trap-13]|uniref:immunoglobulin-like domain-containing protein n=1 Tax=Moritella sp. Urea-trap-13 TaxID=2058327 RepID=UPI000C337B4C|nr:immunoglobulin-like domain-containing protein [Moritella sp. Urea-trap-13]PKH05520.1 chitinase [Moritella sp. Urea-trap-13]
MKLKSILSAAILTGLCSTAAVAGTITSQDNNVVVGYWHNWCDGRGYQGGNAPCVELEAVNPQYNVVNISFMKVYDTADGSIPTFKLDPTIGLSEAEFIAQINTLNSQGRSVLIALGGADAHIELTRGDEDALATEIIRLTDLYGFDGLDIDLEQAAITAKDNQFVIPAALKMVKDHYRKTGDNFMITMAPEFPYLTANGAYTPYLTELDGYYDFINPQFYNQGGDGLWIEGLGWIAQDNDELKEEFIYYIADSLINGTRNYHKIPHDKLVFGLPSSIDAAATGYIKEPQDLYNAFERLKAQGQPLRGVMTWSVNWDMGTDAANNSYNQQFIKDYGNYIHNQLPPVTDMTPTLAGIVDTRVELNNSFDPLIGITAKDYQGNDITADLTVSGSVNTNQVGDYLLTYSVSSDDETANQGRKVTVYQLLPSFAGITDTSIVIGSPFDPMQGVSASHPTQGDLTANITVTGEVDNNVVGEYELTYTLSYGQDNQQTITNKRTITVVSDAVSDDDWQVGSTYVKYDKVTHNGTTWTAQWWTKGEEPGTTGEWGVWR